MFRRNIIRRHIRNRFAVETIHGGSFTGVLIDADKDTYQFSAVKVRTADAYADAAGNVFIARDHVQYIQHLPAEGV